MESNVQELVASNGDVRLASERLGVSVHDMMKSLLAASDLRESIMASISLQLLDLISNYKVALIAALDEMNPKDLSNSFIGILQAFNDLGGSGRSQPNNGLNLLQVFEGDANSARDRILSKLTSTPAPAGWQDS